MYCEWDEAAQGVKVSAFAELYACAADAFCSFNYRVLMEADGGFSSSHAVSSHLEQQVFSYDVPDIFQTGPMAAGWEETKWTAKGLPASGVLRLTLTVHSVGHIK